MTKYILFPASLSVLAACSMPQLGRLAGDAAKAKVTCDGISESIVLSASEATDFVKDLKNLDKNSAVCQKNEKFCVALLAAGVSKTKCSVQPVL